ncbi:methylenetetrahydrofolate reductase [Ruminococcus gauvreauii]|uniref:Methylenetetrahydrofolate reductase n=1 Tax=Ruminococcus gauvreauii TaxID=438033 RepID=A0ABY5VIT3_9FIRM|nr:methylenetetrahydrofolate reductase [Ruminococcus gauvreauii]UWP60121.1 methylenetetrahydrofolate reductase [Ruminococcus gauvreauii]
MSIVDIMKERMSFSFEVFPPKPEQPMEPLLDTLSHLYEFQPDFISCTYGAGGTNVGRNVEVCKAIQDSGKSIAVTHFTCIGNTREGVKEQLDHYLELGVNHILALRGDLPAGWEGTRGDFHYASDLVSYIREEFGDKFTIAMAGDPEKHIQCPTEEEDIAHLKIKQDAGADYMMTQLCFDVKAFEVWRDKIQKAGVHLPIDIGLMPVLNKDATIRMALSMNGCSIPKELARIISKYYDDPEGFRKAGMEYTVNQIFEYMNAGIDGLHIYALNKWEAVTDIINMAGIRTQHKN